MQTRRDLLNETKTALANWFKAVGVALLQVVAGVVVGVTASKFGAGDQAVLWGVGSVVVGVILWVVYALTKIKKRDGAITSNDKAKMNWY